MAGGHISDRLAKMNSGLSIPFRRDEGGRMKCKLKFWSGIAPGQDRSTNTSRRRIGKGPPFPRREALKLEGL